ncbi:MAG TPA: hypothetical protein VF211_15945 [Burkholderiales bacterium]
MALTLDDCLALCELTEDEVLASAEHENLPEIVAATARGDHARAALLERVVRDFVLRHLHCEARHRAELHSPERRMGQAPGKGTT